VNILSVNKDTTDIDLWEQTRSGNKKAFEALFKRYYRFLLHHGLKHTRDQNVLEDCIQELFIDLWKKAPVTELKLFRAYLFQAFRFKIYRHLQASDQFQKMKLPIIDDSRFTLSHEHFLIGNEESTELATQIQNAISKLSKRQQEIIYLRFYQNMDYEEIGHVMQINYQVSRNLLCQAIKALKTDLSISPLFPVIWLISHGI